MTQKYKNYNNKNLNSSLLQPHNLIIFLSSLSLPSCHGDSSVITILIKYGPKTQVRTQYSEVLQLTKSQKSGPRDQMFVSQTSVSKVKKLIPLILKHLPVILQFASSKMSWICAGLVCMKYLFVTYFVICCLAYCTMCNVRYTWPIQFSK